MLKEVVKGATFFFKSLGISPLPYIDILNVSFCTSFLLLLIVRHIISTEDCMKYILTV